MGAAFAILPCEAGEGDRVAVEGANPTLRDQFSPPPPCFAWSPSPVAMRQGRIGTAS